MILITKDESEVIRGVYPDASIARTMKQRSDRHRYYLTEDEKYLRLIISSNFVARKIIADIDAKRRQINKFKRRR